MKKTTENDQQPHSVSITIAGMPKASSNHSEDDIKLPTDTESSTKGLRRSTRIRKPTTFSESEPEDLDELNETVQPSEKRRKRDDGKHAPAKPEKSASSSTTQDSNHHHHHHHHSRHGDTAKDGVVSSAVQSLPLTTRRANSSFTASKTPDKPPVDDFSDLKFPELPPAAAAAVESKPPTAEVSQPQHKRKQERVQQPQQQQRQRKLPHVTVTSETIDTNRPYIVNQWLQIVRFGTFSWCQSPDAMRDANSSALLSSVCHGTVWPIGWESHRLFGNPHFAQGSTERRPHICTVTRDDAGKVVFRIYVDGELLEHVNPQELMKAFRARFTGCEPKSSLGRAWLQSCEHFFGLTSVDSTVRSMEGHDAALRSLQQEAVALPMVRMPPPPPIFSEGEIFEPEQPWTLVCRRRRRTYRQLQQMDRDAAEESSGSETECDTSALYADSIINRSYADMTEVSARELLRNKDDEVARLRAIIERGEELVHHLVDANNQWLTLNHLRTSRMITDHIQQQQQYLK